jgi:ATP-dependent Clp protease ATP-binding subunit ClpC
VAADKSVFVRFLGAGSSETEIREAIVRATGVRPLDPTRIDLPLSNECKRILAYGAEEAYRLGRQNIDAEHLLLGLNPTLLSPGAICLQLDAVYSQVTAV